jgi:hypothetical protein
MDHTETPNEALNAAQRALALCLDKHRYERNPAPWLLHMREAQGAMSRALSSLAGYSCNCNPGDGCTLITAEGRTQIGNTPTCEDCGKPLDHCICVDGEDAEDRVPPCDECGCTNGTCQHSI